MTKIDSTGAAAVDHGYFWQPIATCPLGVKVQLNSRAGVATYGVLSSRNNFWTHWAPLPKMPKESA